MQFSDYFKGKKVTVMGLGLLGRGIGDAMFIAEAGAQEVTVTDKKSAEELATSVAQLEHLDNVKFILGEHRMEDFEERDLILVAAGVPMDSPYLEHARKAGVPLKQSAALFAELSEIPIVGITGTRGKSTTTHMIHHVLRETFDGTILLGGNVRGLSNLQLLKQVTEDSIAVLELDSWQLQGFGWAKRSPHIAVFTNFMPDHMNYYHGDMDAYFSDKANIFRYQEDHDVLVTVPEVFEWAKKMKGATLGQEVILVDESLIPEDAILAMPGEHNRLNAALAYKALEALGLSEEEIFAGLASFPGVEGRLQYLGEVNDVKIYNDNNATTPQAVIMGMKAVGNVDDKNIIWIGGGAKKDIDTTELLTTIPQYCKKVVLLEGTGTDTIKDLIECEVMGNVKSAVKAGLAMAEAGDVLLFSPGFASFGMFKNEYERNDIFMEVINSLQI
ncbi:MAG: UDP-N-acetylmuramoyl-L-alanine--D-glutamate ligase [Candidatus Pacebacteria bacterium]|nr:UDP-N-acetylmuramoyl-L-alanine--D-glutamate ligase [Candidatus Paceibacterota bacterium]MBP6924281.1 UDP-N-acetylmuramoyl-L-alanine--D-glutamate ligase [Candidatus Paceibacterota bacterium]